MIKLKNIILFNNIELDSYLRNPFKWHAKTKRKDFWVPFLVVLTFRMALETIVMCADKDIGSISTGIVNIIYYLILLGIFVCNLGITIRRLHDAGHSGACWWLNFIPIVGQIILIVFLCEKSDKHSFYSNLEKMPK